MQGQPDSTPSPLAASGGVAPPRRLRALWRLARTVLHGLHGLLIVLLRFPGLGPVQRQVRIGWWSRKLLRLLGLQLRTHGTFRPGAKLIVANHVSWLDIAAIHALCPQARFVSKAEVKQWPLVGRLVDGAGTLYLQRERARDAMRVLHAITQALQQGDTVAVFPEGTTGAGHELLPFHANLLQAVIASGAPVQPVALRYSDPLHAVSPAARFVGDTTLGQSLWRLACAQGLAVDVQVLPPQSVAHADRRALAVQLRETIAEALQAR
ncbi:lysophospholipid acyltransferase family protein [Azohydromonas caseinilytica]|uniref:1-acyl-sn-glycerol-3-phosphate acyltransferase n=1 Tax=Azohydromonas caseinilytica TaxID=2728836 RepID=A0A848FAA4_9BURK|nr:lysophospholipid acyltransferase family protein [Azohydromonas caseinilytica]NML15140.1 1-acyl-sn-glycerol-3-phosphate acyltransferase [Azohydromonas caseinilytica]